MSLGTRLDTVKLEGTQLDTIGQRIRAERERLRLNQVDFASLGGVQKNAQINYEAGKRAPDASYLAALADAGVDVLYVVTGRRERDLMAELAESISGKKEMENLREALSGEREMEQFRRVMQGFDDLAPIPRFDARVSAGPGSQNVDAMPVGSLAFRRDWLARIGVAPSNAVLVRVSGDSMVPSLHDGDLVLIDMSRKEPRGGQVYALTDTDGSTRVKRIDLLPTGLILRSDAPSFEPEFRSTEDANRMSIIGQVVWSGHTW